MKRLCLGLVCILFSAICSAETVNTDALNVRSEPNSESSILGKLERGEQVDVISNENGWSKIVFNEQEGCVASKFLSQNPKTQGSKNDKTVVGTVLGFLGKICIGILAGLVLLYKPLKSFMEQLGFGGLSTIVAIIVEIILVGIISAILNGIIQQFTIYRCKSCGKIGALKYAGSTESLGTWVESEKKVAEIRSKRGDVIGTRDEYVPVTKEETRSLYRCKYCGHEVYIHSTHTK